MAAHYFTEMYITPCTPVAVGEWRLAAVHDNHGRGLTENIQGECEIEVSIVREPNYVGDKPSN